jgi:hypothetical protein
MTLRAPRIMYALGFAFALSGILGFLAKVLVCCQVIWMVIEVSYKIIIVWYDFIIS